MSKVVTAVLAVGAAVVGFIVGGPIGAAIGFGAVLGISALRPKVNAKNTASDQRLNKQLRPDDFRKIVFGETACAADERYWESYGAAGYDEVIACATHEIESFGKFYLDGVEETFSGSTSTGVYAGKLTKDNKTVGVTATGITTTGAGTNWTSAAAFTGCAHYRLRWTYDQAKMPNGIPGRFCQIVKGAKVYDPRKDTTVGGSGSHRYDNQATWEYSPLDSNSIPIGRNNALQMLWYLIGWRITNPATSEKVLVAGRGVDTADIDWASWITAANACETEQYYTDCILSTGDSHDTNEGIIAAGAQGILLDTGGLWSYWVSSDDTASVAIALTDDDVISGVNWRPRDGISAQQNEAGGTFIDPSVTALYQASPYPPIKDTTYLSEDGGVAKRATLDFQNVQSATLAQKNARTYLNRSRWTGTFEATFNYKILKAKNWDIVTLTFPRLGFTTKLFRIVSMGFDPKGGVRCTLREESTGIYTAGSTSSYTAVGSGVAYDVRQSIALSGLAAVALDVSGSGNQHYDGITVSWTAVGANVKSVEVQYRKTGDTIWQDGGVATQAGGAISSVNIWPVISVTGYDIQARTISIDNVPGAWASTTVTSGNYSAFVTPKADGTSLVSTTTAGSDSYTVVASDLGFVQITLNGPRGGIGDVTGTGPWYGAAGGIVVHHIAVTVGDVISWTLGSNGANSNSGAGGNGGTSTVTHTPTSTSLTANGGAGGTVGAHGTPGGSASGGNVSNTTGANGNPLQLQGTLSIITKAT